MDGDFKTYKYLIEELYAAFQFYYPKFFNPNFEGETKGGVFVYNGTKIPKEKFIEDVLSLTNARDNLDLAFKTLVELHQSSDQELFQTVPTRETLQKFGDIVERESAAAKKMRAEIKTGTEEAIKTKERIAKENAERLKEFQKAAKDKEVFAKVNRGETKLSPDQKLQIENLKAEATKHPEDLTNVLTEKIEKGLKESGAIKGTDDEVYSAAYLSAQNMVATLQGRPPIVEAMILKKAIEAGSFKNITGFTASSRALASSADAEVAAFLFSKNVSETVFGKPFSDSIFEVPKSVEVSSAPKAGFIPFEIPKIVHPEPSILVETPIPTAGGPLFVRYQPRPSIVPISQVSVKTNVDSAISTFKGTPSGAGAGKVVQVEGPKISTASVAVKGFGNTVLRSLSNLFSKLGISLKKAEGSQGVLIAGGSLLTIAAAASGNTLLAGIGGVSAVTGFVINPANVFSGGAFASMMQPIWALGKGLLEGVVEGVVLPIILTLLLIPFVIAIILFIINSGAYIIPLPSLGGPGAFTSPYIDVTKLAEPAGPFKNSDLPKTITYTVTIKAKKSVLSNISIADDCQVISKTQSKCPDFSQPADKPDTIDPSKPYSFTYTVTYGKEFTDSSIVNTITVKADSYEQRGVAMTTSASVSFGTPPITCPLINGRVASPLLNYSYNGPANTGHGSKRYWQAMRQGPSAYPLPQSTNCFSPSACSYYGYAYDVFPSSSTEVFAPTVLGKSISWSCSYAFPNGGGKQGYTFHCMSSDGNEMLVLTHMSKNIKGGNINSGEKIGSLYNQGDNTHLHIEFQLNGRYVKPETYFCGGK